MLYILSLDRSPKTKPVTKRNETKRHGLHNKKNQQTTRRNKASSKKGGTVQQRYILVHEFIQLHKYPHTYQIYILSTPSSSSTPSSCFPRCERPPCLPAPRVSACGPGMQYMHNRRPVDPLSFLWHLTYISMSNMIYMS